MNTRRWLIVACAGIVSPLIMLVALLNNGDKFGWLESLIFGPGRYLAGLFESGKTPYQHPRWYFQVSFGIDFLIIWIALLIVAFLLEKLFTRRKMHA